MTSTLLYQIGLTQKKKINYYRSSATIDIILKQILTMALNRFSFLINHTIFENLFDVLQDNI